MVGKNNGVWTRLSGFFSLFSINHDGAHKVNLSANETMKTVP